MPYHAYQQTKPRTGFVPRCRVCGRPWNHTTHRAHTPYEIEQRAKAEADKADLSLFREINFHPKETT